MLVPITIHYVNPTRYGIWITLSSIIMWMEFFDIGLGHGLRNRFAEALAKNEEELARIYVSTTYAVLGLIVSSALILFVFINPLLNWTILLNAPPEMADELTLLAFVVFSAFCFRFVLRLVQVIFIADQQPAMASLLQLLGHIVMLCGVFILTKVATGSLIYLGLILSLAPVMILSLASVVIFNGRYRAYAPSLKYVRFKHFHELMGLGAMFFVLQISVLLTTQTASIIIIQLHGPEEVAAYNIAFRYFSVLIMFFTIVASPYWSAITEAYTVRDIQWIRKTIRNLMFFVMSLALLACIMYFISDWIYLVWIGEVVQVSKGLSLYLALYSIVFIWNATFIYFLNGVGKIRLQVYYAIIAALLNVPLGVLLGSRLGPKGVVLASVIVSAAGMVLYPIQYYKIINDKALGIWAR